MEILEIEKIENDYYTLLNKETEKRYTFHIQFYGLTEMPKVKDLIAVNSQLLDKDYAEYSDFYQFGPIDESYGRKIDSKTQPDFIELSIGKNIIHLKRFFG